MKSPLEQTTEPEISLRVTEVRRAVEESLRRSGRAPGEVTLIAVSKTHPVEVVREALAAGLGDFGENRVQEAEAKIGELKNCGARWHLIGHLQKNKARRAVQLFDCIHTLDSVELAARLDELCAQEGRDQLDVLVQIDLGGEQSKSGLAERELPLMAERLRGAAHLRLRGLMTLPPFFADAEEVRPFFRRLRELRDDLQKSGAFADAAGELSMGMSHDYAIAIEEGATMVRVGTAIFGARDQGQL